MIPQILKQDLRQRTISELSRSEMQSLKNAILSLQILDVDHVHETFLPWLAWWFRAEQWDNTWPIEHKRTAVKEALILFRYKGTPWAVIRAIELHGFDSELIEWHEQVPVGINGTFKIIVPIIAKNARSITASIQNSIKNAIDSNKRGSQHWSIEYTSKMTETVYIGAYQKQIYKIKIGPKPINPSVNTLIIAAPYITTNNYTEILLR
ncbi:phage tail protein I [Photobacterium damselae subsp. damselae]|uniref:phage tail protein I n=1 Tax=Photobacterium damselae TaxID=38293 RepID=UPI001EEED48B|nr:phage tail protein I [Photobacterium damselae]UJZ95061.1 phage tail protein I [Photobacterium damselae subsp. damselae]UJZ99042.1 phage tail protein I [Photobacterium damselae subsp. damselae]